MLMPFRNQPSARRRPNTIKKIKNAWRLPVVGKIVVGYIVEAIVVVLSRWWSKGGVARPTGDAVSLGNVIPNKFPLKGTFVSVR